MPDQEPETSYTIGDWVRERSHMTSAAEGGGVSKC